MGVFEKAKDGPAAVGGYTHAFVDRKSRKSTPIIGATRLGLAKIFMSQDDGTRSKL